MKPEQDYSPDPVQVSDMTPRLGSGAYHSQHLALLGREQSRCDSTDCCCAFKSEEVSVQFREELPVLGLVQTYDRGVSWVIFVGVT